MVYNKAGPYSIPTPVRCVVHGSELHSIWQICASENALCLHGNVASTEQFPPHSCKYSDMRACTHADIRQTLGAGEQDVIVRTKPGCNIIGIEDGYLQGRNDRTSNVRRRPQLHDKFQFCFFFFFSWHAWPIWVVLFVCC